MARSAESALVEAWDEAMAQPRWRRALVVLAALDAASSTAVAHLPVGAVSTRLLALARRWSVRRIDTVATCPACNERLDVVLGIDELLAGAPPAEPEPGPFRVRVGERWFDVRLPTPADLAAVAAAPDPATAERDLLWRLVGREGLAAQASEESWESTVEAVSAAMAERDPYGVIAVDVVCPGCTTPTRTVFDVGAWFWGVVDSWVRRLLGDVHRLARAYGWTEPDVLALGPHRRAAYLELVP